DDVVLLDADETQHGIEQKGDGVGLIGGVIGQRLHVALHGLELRAHLFRPAGVLILVRQKKHQTADRDEALTDFRTQVALAAEREQNSLIDARGAAAAAALLENPARNLVDLGADALENVGIAV